MKKTHLLLIIFLIPLLFSSCEKYIFCKKGKGEIIHQKRSVNNFNEIDFGIPGKLIIRQSATTSVEIVAQQNLVNEIKTDVIGSKLKIRTDGCIKTSDSLFVYVSVPSITELDILGSGDISQDGAWHFNGVSFVIEGTGTISLKNFTCNGNIENKILGSGSIALQNFSAKSFYNEITGTGDIVMINADSCTSSKSKIVGTGDISLSSKDTLASNDMTISGAGDAHFFEVVAKNSDVDITGTGSAYVFVLSALEAKIEGTGNIYYRGQPKINLNITGTGKLKNDN